MYGYIYKTTCLVNNKIYVGKHKSKIFNSGKYIGSGKLFTYALKKYGKSNFICEVLEWCETVESLNARERFWIKELDARNPAVGYNISVGGENAFTGMKRVYNETEIKWISYEELSKYLEAGWQTFVSKEYTKQYRESHKEEMQAYSKTYTVSGKKAESSSRYYQKHKEEIKQKSHNKFIADKEKENKRHKEYRHKNADKVKDYSKKYYQEHKDKFKLYQEKCRQKKKINKND